MLNSHLTRIVLSVHFFFFLGLPAGKQFFAAETNDTNTIASESRNDVTMVHLNKNVAAFVKSYIRKNDETLARVKEKSKLHFGMMDSMFIRYKLPVELKYLAVVESELNPRAVSRVGAVGPWQFMPKTAVLLGLKVTAKYDERRLYKKSTKAAAIYLRDLHNEFGDWLLVLAAYNAGPGPVYKAIKKSGSRNFWKLQYHLPEETRSHVKKIIATHYYFEGQASLVIR